MSEKTIKPYLEQLAKLDFKNMYNNDFLHTWDKTTDELRAMYLVADALRNLRERPFESDDAAHSFCSMNKGKPKPVEAPVCLEIPTVLLPCA